MTHTYPLYSSVRATTPDRYLSLAEVVDLVRSPTVGPKSNAPALTPFHAEAKTKDAAVKAQYHALVMDHDDDNLTAAEIRSLYGTYGVAYLLWASSSHQQDKGGVTANRWKVLIPLSSASSYERYTALAAGLTIHHGADPAQARAQQVFYAPNKLTPGAPYEYIDATECPFLDPDDTSHPLVVAALSANRQEQEARQQKAVQAPVRARQVSANDAGIIGKVCQQYDMEGELQRHGYRRVGRKYLSPNSTTGVPGVHIFT
ncbi:MAG: hypothetical protein VX920_08080, partial [Pseudomonadota bacterium]|nr:hypothetical protein [Pseudomonadota bacterium]